jgi:hypothetical protein
MYQPKVGLGGIRDQNVTDEGSVTNERNS